MENQAKLADILDHHMKQGKWGNGRLAKQALQVAPHLGHLHRNNIRNWRNSSSQTAREWQPIAAIAVALGLNREEAGNLLTAAGWSDVYQLKRLALEPEDKALLEHWPTQDLIPQGLTDSKPNPSKIRLDGSPILEAFYGRH